jgi:hypothetical protein
MTKEIAKMLSQLEKKGCKILNNGLIDIIDISQANNLGNKSWGKIEYLSKNGFIIKNQKHDNDESE